MSDTQIADALELERNYFSRAMQDGGDKANAEIQALQRQLAAKGMAGSGPRYQRELEIRLNVLATVVAGAVLKRKKLGCRFPDLFTQTHLNDLRVRLEQRIDSATSALKQNRVFDTAIPGVSEALSRHANSIAGTIRARMIQELDALRLEAKLGFHREENSMTVNISNSTIASLNLGTVLGDLSVSMQNLNEQGHQELATLIQNLAERVGTSSQLDDTSRKEALEHLSIVSSEMARPADQRRLGPLKTSVGYLRKTLSVAAALAALWTPVLKLLKGLGVELPE